MDRREEGRIGWGWGSAWNILGMLSSWDEGVGKVEVESDKDAFCECVQQRTGCS